MAHATSSDHGHAHGGGHGHAHDPNHPIVGHLVPVSTLVGTAVALLVLTVLTVAVRWVDAGEANIVIALTIAVIKGSLVALFFMHLWWDRPFNSFCFVAALAFVGLFMGLALMDTFAYGPSINRGLAPDAKLVLEKEDPAAPLLSEPVY